MQAHDGAARVASGAAMPFRPMNHPFVSLKTNGGSYKISMVFYGANPLTCSALQALYWVCDTDEAAAGSGRGAGLSGHVTKSPHPTGDGLLVTAMSCVLREYEVCCH